MRSWCYANIVAAVTLGAGCQHTPIEKPAKQTGGTGGIGGMAGMAAMGGTVPGSGGGGTNGCASADECPGTDDECKSRACKEGVCDWNYVPEGTPLAAQTPADCKRHVCNGAGEPKFVTDTTDPFMDGNPCSDDICAADTPANPPSAAGSPCIQGSGTVCDGAGACVECLANVDCAAYPQDVCQSHACVAAACTDGVKDGKETDLDCGGACAPCADGKGCSVAGDCASGICVGQQCAVSSCSDKVKNGSETDIDCGGTCPDKCGPGGECKGNQDCVGGKCNGTTCAPTCTDKVTNGSETDVDCGGTCGACADGKACSIAADCASGVCVGAVPSCAAPTCADNVKNGSETDIDCGGPTCGKCADEKSCSGAADCSNGLCDGGKCGLNGCNPATAPDITSSPTVEFHGVVYVPACFKVKAGTVVTFTGTDPNPAFRNFFAHPLVGGKISGDNTQQFPSGSGPFYPTTSVGGLTTKDFALPAGNHGFYCGAHWLYGMKGAAFAY